MSLRVPMAAAVFWLPLARPSVPPGFVLRHAYDFTSGADGDDVRKVADSVQSDCAATIWGGAALSGGGLVLDGVDDYVDFPQACVGATVGEASFLVVEACFLRVSCNGRPSNVFDFGSGPGESVSLSLPARVPGAACAPTLAIAMNDADGAASYEAPSPPSPPPGESVVCFEASFSNDTSPPGALYDAATGTYYATSCGGSPAACRRVPADLGETTANYVGKSQYATDA